MRVTLCNKKLIGDIPVYKFESIQEGFSVIWHWLNNKDFNNSVFVCFATINNLPNNQRRNQYDSILVSHNLKEIGDWQAKINRQTPIDEIDFAIFEFGSYKDAFGYCTDLTEGF